MLHKCSNYPKEFSDICFNLKFKPSYTPHKRHFNLFRNYLKNRTVKHMACVEYLCVFVCVSREVKIEEGWLGERCPCPCRRPPRHPPPPLPPHRQRRPPPSGEVKIAEDWL